MRINKEFLKNLKPCTDRYKNFLEHNCSFDGGFSDFLDLDTISYGDKMWVAERIIKRNQAVKWAILCAESVLPIFENRYPVENRLSDCINFLKTVKDFNSLTDVEMLEIKNYVDASRSIYGVASDTSDAARAVTYATHCATHAATHAAHVVYVTACAADIYSTAGAAALAIRAADSVTYARAFCSTKHSATTNISYITSYINYHIARQKQLDFNIQLLKQVTSL